jgi:hypothetical protein
MRLRHVLLGGYFALATLGLIWPGYAWVGNRIAPFVLGLPMSFAYNLGWVVLTFAVLVAYDLSDKP